MEPVPDQVQGIIEGREYRTEDDLNVVGFCQLSHGGNVPLNHLQGRRSGVSGNVIGAGKDNYSFGLKVNDVGSEPDQHLRRGLPADTAVDKMMHVEKIGRIFLSIHR